MGYRQNVKTMYEHFVESLQSTPRMRNGKQARIAAFMKKAPFIL
jgi:hypothetical protein